MKHIAKHLPHYFSLLGILVVGVLAFAIFSYDKAFQLGVAIALATAYVAWGVIHHWLHRDLHLSVVIEYVVVACLGLFIVFSLILRG